MYIGGLAYYTLGTETQKGLDWQLEKLEGSKIVRLIGLLIYRDLA